jgi:hypothetical protein
VSLAQAALLRLVNLAAAAFGPGLPREAEALIATATNGAGLGTEDRAEVTAALDVLLRACAEEAELSSVGRSVVHVDTVRRLATLHRLAAEEAREPAIRQERIEAPLFITGLPRSGTTFLHRLLACDPDVRAPRAWQTIYPYPDASAQPGGADTRVRQVQRQLDWFALIAPGLRSVHPMDAQSPQECTEITAHLFQSLRFETVYHIPSYKAWLAAHGHEAAYRFHKRFLQHLQHQESPPRPLRWVLKCPDHVFALPALRAAYPDARIVFLHRDPLKVLPSVAQLTEILRIPFARRVNRSAIGQQVLEDWVRAAQILIAEVRQPSIAAGQMLHLRYHDIVKRPLETISMLYNYFGIELTTSARAAMAAYVAARPRGGYGVNRYSFERHGLDPTELRARFAEYTALFGITPEIGADGGRPPSRTRAPLAAAVTDSSNARS